MPVRVQSVHMLQGVKNNYVGRAILFRAVTSDASVTVCLRFSTFAHMLLQQESCGDFITRTPGVFFWQVARRPAQQARLRCDQPAGA